MKRAFSKIAALCVSIALICICIMTLFACNDTKHLSKEISIRDFSDTHTISVKVSVRNHTCAPNAFQTFEYGKGFDKLYEAIKEDSVYRNSVQKDNGIIVIDFADNVRTYSCIIYPSGQADKYVIHSMTYTLGKWADYQAIFFPSYLLDKEISPDDGAETTYRCAYKIDALAGYYKTRGYYAEISDNKLKVVCMLRYPTTFKGQDGEYGRKAVAWTVVYENDTLIRFADVSNSYA